MAAGRVRRRTRIAAGCTVVILALVAGWLLWARAVIFHPTVASLHSADAIVVLGPFLTPRQQQAEQLASTYHIDDIVYSVGDTPMQESGVCSSANRSAQRPRISCFVPDPYNTRGEAREIGSLARSHHWTNVVVIAQQVQLSRARLLIGRCFSGEVQMVPAAGTVGIGGAYDLFHQTGGFVKAALQRGC